MSTEPTLNWTMVEDAPSVTVEMMCQTPLRLATESSIFLVTCDSSSLGAAPDWVIITWTIGMSMLGKISTSMRDAASAPISMIRMADIAIV